MRRRKRGSLVTVVDGARLAGLEGTNPLGFFAALGVQVAFAEDAEQPRLWWSDDVTPHAIVDRAFTPGRIATRALEVFAEWRQSTAMNPTRPDGSQMPKADELKLSGDDLRHYVGQHHRCRAADAFAAAAVAEGSLDNKGAAKPTDLYFMAGNMKFLKIVRDILDQVSYEDVVEAIKGPWTYGSKLPTMMWDIRDDRVYAFRADDPSKDKKLTNPGAEALAILAMAWHPVFAGRDRTCTPGCRGTWSNGLYSWPLWVDPASSKVVRTFISHASIKDEDDLKRRSKWFRSWSISHVLESPIRRPSPACYGTFGPPTVRWSGSRL